MSLPRFLGIAAANVGSGLASFAGSFFKGALRGVGTLLSTEENYGGGGKASSKVGASSNYNPLPAFTETKDEVRKLDNPTLTDVSNQLVEVLATASLITDTLRQQFELQKWQYKDQARLQREINAEKNKSVSDIPGTLSPLAILGPILESLTNLSEKLNDTSANGFPAILALPLGKSAKGAGKNIKPHDYSFKKKSEALDKKGKLKPGYEEVKTKSGTRYRLANKGAVGVAEKAGLAGVGKQALHGVGRVAGSLAKPVIVAMTAWEAWKQIQAIPEDLSPEKKRSQVAKIVGKLVGDVGIIWASMALGGLIGSAVPGAGTLVGILSGAAIGVGADYLIGDNVDSIVDNVVDTLYPIGKDKKTPIQIKPEPKKGEVKEQLKPPVAATKTVKKQQSIGEVLTQVSNRVGIDQNLLLTMAKRSNEAINLEQQADKAGNVFGLSQDQWSQIASKYSNSFPELLGGITNSRASLLAGALLLKEGQAFLNKNDVETTQDALYASVVLGNKGLDKLLKTDSTTLVAETAPEVTGKHPELFVNPVTKSPLSIKDFFKQIYNLDYESAKRPAPEPETPPKVPTGSNNTTAPPAITPTTSPGEHDATPVSPDAIPVTPPTSPVTAPPTTSSSEDQEEHDATPVSPDAIPVTPEVDTGTNLSATSSDIEAKESTGITSTVIPTSTNSSGITPTTSSPSNASSETGAVPDPTFDLGDLAKGLFFNASSTKAGVWL